VNVFELGPVVNEPGEIDAAIPEISFSRNWTSSIARRR
jgi:hypothetical protein